MLEIVNLEKLVNFTRRLIFYNFDEYQEEMTNEDFLQKVSKIETKDIQEIENVLPFIECENIFKELLKRKVNKKTKKVKYFMRESDYEEVLSMLNQRMISNIVQSLVKKGALDSAYDSEKNDFVFWVKNVDKDAETN
jgi:hypothetical protein